MKINTITDSKHGSILFKLTVVGAVAVAVAGYFSQQKTEMPPTRWSGVKCYEICVQREKSCARREEVLSTNCSSERQNCELQCAGKRQLQSLSPGDN